MPGKSIFNLMDRSSAESVLRGATGSLCGMLATGGFIVICLWIYLNPVFEYTSGKYYETEFHFMKNPNKILYTQDDILMAIVFKSKNNASVLNHTQILANFSNQAFYTNANFSFQENLVACDLNYFANATNPVKLTDCLIFPNQSQIMYNIILNVYSKFGILAGYSCPSPFLCKAGNAYLTAQQNLFMNFYANNYFELYFTSKIVTSDGSQKFLVHKIDSSQYNTPFTVGAIFDVEYALKTTTMDDSVWPNWNNKTFTNLVWDGLITGSARALSQLNSTTTTKFGITPSQYQYQAYRYYKKLDWLLGIIGGGIFLLYLFFSLPCTYVNRCFQKMYNAESLFLERTEHQKTLDSVERRDSVEIVENPSNLSRVKPLKISFTYFIENFIPFFQTKQVKIVEKAERMLDIATLIKKGKIIERNLKKGGIYQSHQIQKKVRKLRFKEESLASNLIKIENPRVIELSMQVVLQNNNEWGGALNNEHNENNQVQTQNISLNERLEVEDTSEIDKSEEQLLNVHSIVIKAVRESHNALRIYETDSTVMLIKENSDQFNQIETDQIYNKQYHPTLTKCQRVTNHFFNFIRFFDFFGAKPMFLSEPANYSLFGVFITSTIIILSVLTFALTITNMSSIRLYFANNFQNPDQINYSLSTSNGFRPVVCLPAASFAFLNGTGKIADVKFYSYNAISGESLIQTNLMKANDYASLGLIPGDYYYDTSNTSNILTQYCYSMVDNYTINMAGFNTSNEAYFGFKISPFCSGTISYCTSTAASLTLSFNTFMNTYAPTLLLPLNQYNTGSESIYGGIYVQNLREGTTNFNMAKPLEETVYVNEVLLRADYDQSFYQKEAIISQHSIGVDRNAPNEMTRGLPTNDTYYNCKIRPSGKQTIVTLYKTKIDFLFGTIGGCFYLYFCLFMFLAKLYNIYNVRAKLAQEIYQEHSYQQNFFIKFCHLLPFPWLCFISKCCVCSCKQTLLRMKLVQQKIMHQLNALELAKQLDSSYRLSSSLFYSYEAKNISKMYFKEKINQFDQVKPVIQVNDKNYSQEGDSYEYDGSIWQQNNETDSKRGVMNEHEQQNQKQQVLLKDEIANNPIKEEVIVDVDGEYQFERKSNVWEAWRKNIKNADMFHCNAELTLNGQRRIRSVFGACLSLLLVALTISIYFHYLKTYNDRNNYQISTSTQIITDIFDDSLNFSDDNFKMVLGFYNKPNNTLVNVSSIVNMKNEVKISVFQYSILRSPSQVLSQNVTKYDLIPCSDSYLNGFISANVDPSYYANLTNGYCLPSNVSLTLKGQNDPSLRQYFKFSIYNSSNSTASVGNLSLLMSNYAVMGWMSCPVPNINGSSFSMTVKQIRMTSNVISRAYNYNITLNKANIISDSISNPSYPNNPNTVTSYIYNQNLAYELNYSSLTATPPKTYNITFNYRNIVTNYQIVYTKLYQLFGFAGGIILIFAALLMVIAQNFNIYYMKYQIGQKLYIFVTPNQKNVKKQVQISKQLKKINNYTELQIFGAWLLSFLGDLICNYDILGPTLRRVTLIQQRVEIDMNLYNFQKKFVHSREQINQNIKISQNPKILATQFYPKIILQRANDEENNDQIIPINQIISQEVNQQNFSPFEQIKIIKAIKKDVNIEEVVEKNLLTHLTRQSLKEVNFERQKALKNQQIQEIRRSKEELLKSSKQTEKNQTKKYKKDLKEEENQQPKAKQFINTNIIEIQDFEEVKVKDSED